MEVAVGRGEAVPVGMRVEREDSSLGPLVEKASGWALNAEGEGGFIPHPKSRKASRATGTAPRIATSGKLSLMGRALCPL